MLTANQGYSTRPESVAFTPFSDPLHVRGILGHLCCAHKGFDYLMGIQNQLFKKFAEVVLEWLVFWPYDEGGCGCKEDWPFGGHGFPRLSSAIADSATQLFPALKAIASTWCFDQPVVNGNEYDRLDSFIRTQHAAGRHTFEFIMVDDHNDFPLWLGKHGGKVGNLSLVNFPEISMWGRAPWGGCGANPLPGRFQHLWDDAVLRGDL